MQKEQKKEKIYWHDYETWGASPQKDKPSQFAGVRTDLDLNIIEETSNLQLLSTLTMLAPFNKIDKQAILEAQNLIDRLKVINTILDLNTFRVVGSTSQH